MTDFPPPPDQPEQPDMQAWRRGDAKPSDNDNNWMTALGVLAVASLGIGIIMVAANVPTEAAFTSDPGDPSLVLVGAGLISVGITGLLLWLVAGAICWQIRVTGGGTK